MGSIVRLSSLRLAVLLGLSLLPMTSAGADGDQTVYDRILNVTWLADANLAAKQTFGVRTINESGSMDYATAVEWVAAMNADGGRGYLGHNNWMLPTTPSNDSTCSSFNKRGGGSFGYGCLNSAMGSLYHKTLGLHEPDTAVPIRDSKAGPFVNFQPYLYWTETPTAVRSQGYITFSLNTGWQGANIPRHNMYVLPMIKGRLPGTPPPTGTGLQVRPDGKTVYDPGADVTWLADANLAATQRFGVDGINPDGSMQQPTAVQWIAAMNKARWLDQTRWELPSSASCVGFDCKAGPLGKLFYGGLALRKGQPVVATPDTRVGAFHNIQPYLYWTCQAQSVQGPCKGAPAPRFAWSFSFGNGFEGTDLVKNNLYVMVYYPARNRRP